MTGFKDGSLSWFEEYAGKACHWFICISHLVERPLRKVAKICLGDTFGPNGFKSELGRRIQLLDTVPTAAAFAAIPCENFPSLEGR